MRIQHRLFILLFGILIASSTAFSQTVSYKPGGGLNVYSEDEMWKLRLLGYIQSTFTYHDVKQKEAADNEFFIRRSRLDFIFDYKDRYQIFAELDARGNRTEMVLAQFDIRYFRQHKIQVGKFITPFSPENTRSSRSLSSVERYNGLNSIFLLPGLDTQYGFMFYGKLPRFEYYLSITNGNGKASANIRENNDSKDLQGRLVYKVNHQLRIGGSFNYANEAPQSLKLVDHTFNSFNEAKIYGERWGYLFDFEYNRNPFLLRAEGFHYDFSSALSEIQQVETFRGGYLEVGYFLFGNTSDGLQLTGRVERAEYGDRHPSLAGPSRINSIVIGNNWYRDGIFRLQLNLIYEMADEASQLANTRFNAQDDAFEILTMLQLKF